MAETKGLFWKGVYYVSRYLNCKIFNQMVLDSMSCSKDYKIAASGSNITDRRSCNVIDSQKKEKLKKKDRRYNCNHDQKLFQKSKFESLGKLTSSLVNEINQPLTAISMIMDNILLRVDNDQIDVAYLKEKCSQAFQDIERIKKYIRYVGDFASNQNVYEKGIVDVNAVIEQAIEFTARLCKNSNVQLCIGLSPKPLFIKGNRYKLEKVIIDLLVNAYDCFEGEPRQTNVNKSIQCIWLSSQKNGQQVTIEVKNNGSELPPEMLNHIFDPFYTQKNGNLNNSMALHLTQAIVQGMSGKIYVKSNRVDYTNVKVVLPIG